MVFTETGSALRYFEQIWQCSLWTVNLCYEVSNSCLFSCRNNKKISSAYSTTETKKATIRLLRTIVVLTQSLQSLPDDVMMTMKLLYYDDGTYFLIHKDHCHTNIRNALNTESRFYNKYM